MWTKDVGRAEAGSYNLLTIIFEVNLKLFSKNPKKKVLFVLRDFSAEEHDGEKIKQDLSEDVKNIWQKIYKPQNLEDKKLEDFFDFEFILMPHMFCEKQKFNEQVEELRNRFDRSTKNSLFSADSQQKNIPIDGLAVYIGRIWSTI